MKKILFITWDSDTSNYLENLFFPIFKGLQERFGMQIHVMQFSWAGAEEVGRIDRIAKGMDIPYVQHPIHRRPHAVLGTLWTVYQGVYHIRRYVQEHGIHTVMPRSTMPAMMVNRLLNFLKKNKVKVVFDADGLSLQERLDYTGLKADSRQYKILKKEESKLLKRADKVLVRTKKAKEIHLDLIGQAHAGKFHIVSNGRDAAFFKPDPVARKVIREKLGVQEEETLFVYSGSLGPQYVFTEMLLLFHRYYLEHGKAKFLVLSRGAGELAPIIQGNLEALVIPLAVDFQEIPRYLSAADVAFNFRLPAPSLAGIAPIKLGEYLMMGLPVISSIGIGDTEDLLRDGQVADKEFCCLVDLKDPDYPVKAIDWIREVVPGLDREQIRAFGLDQFGLERSVEGYGKCIGGYINIVMS
jgi:glycosyltransferase involved in cell wall biosynthesis